MALIPNEPRKRNGILLVLVALAGLYFFYEYWYAVEAEEIRGLEERLESLEEQNRQAQVLAARGEEELEARVMAYERHVNRLEELIPESEELPSLVNAWAMEARNAPVELARIHPEPAREREHYTLQAYEMSVVGDYHGVGRYLTALASLPRMGRPMDVEMNEFNGQAPTDGVSAPVEAHFRVETYVIPSRPGDLEVSEELPDVEEALPEVEDALPDEEEPGEADEEDDDEDADDAEDGSSGAPADSDPNDEVQ